MNPIVIHCVINGKPAEAVVAPGTSLADMLRDTYRLTSVKKGCEVGECGACTVLINGESVNSCLYLAAWAEGKEILTVEGLTGPQGELSPVQQAFIDEGAVQCGFCTPGFLLTAHELFQKGGLYTDEELRKRLSGHLCRCTGYENILKAVKALLSKKDFSKEDFSKGAAP